MVVFTCNNCGDSLQKPKVAKHYQFQCKTLPNLTCVDCLKDFRGQEYDSHTKCITENQRYGGKDYVQKPNENKGERKQLAWINVVQNVLSNSKDLSALEKNFLNSIIRYENIPRKKAKFLNFIKNIHGPKVNMSIVDSVWNRMEKSFKEANQNSQTNDKNNQNVQEGSEKTNGISEKTSKENENANIKKRKLEVEKDEENSLECKKPSIETEEFHWKSTIVEIVTAKGEIPLKKLQKKTINRYLKLHSDVTKEKAIAKFEKKLKKVSNVVVENELAKLIEA